MAAKKQQKKCSSPKKMKSLGCYPVSPVPLPFQTGEGASPRRSRGCRDLALLFLDAPYSALDSITNRSCSLSLVAWGCWPEYEKETVGSESKTFAFRAIRRSRSFSQMPRSIAISSLARPSPSASKTRSVSSRMFSILPARIHWSKRAGESFSAPRTGILILRTSPGSNVMTPPP